MKTTRIWDLATRIFHWLLVFSVIGLIITECRRQCHGVAFPLRLCCLYFAAFPYCLGLDWRALVAIYNIHLLPKSMINYLKGAHPKHHAIGHNPLGALSVFALLLTLSAQVATGLFSDDEIAAVGPLAKYVSNATVSQASFYHTEIGKLFIILLVVSHIGAILFYLLKSAKTLSSR